MSKKCACLLIILTCVCCFVFCHKIQWGPCLVQYAEPCTNDSIEFFITTSDNPDTEPYSLDAEQPKVPDWINLKNSMKIIVHGYAGSFDFNETKIIRNAYLSSPETNVIIVDWGKLAKLPCYPTAVFNTKQAGDCLATLLMGIEAKNRDFKAEKVHAIGFSLGAHVVSFASNKLEKINGKKFERITGLDPALPFFATSMKSWKLDKTDAHFVDVIHTNAGIYGKIESSGHIDFYMNGGQRQPMCKENQNFPLCSHMMAPVYFSESINSEQGFYGVRCNSYLQYVFGWCKVRSRESPRTLMGEYCKASSEGIFFVDTNTEPPYALG